MIASDDALPARILMTTDTVGGVWNYALELSQGLGELGVEVILATMGAPLRPEQHRALAALPHVRAHESTYKLEWMEEPWDDVARAAEWLLELEQRFTPDLIHLNGYAHGALPWRAPTVVVGHSCVLSWWRAVRHEPAPASWSRYARAVRAGLRAADTVVAPSRSMLASLREHYTPLPHGRVVHNGCAATAFTCRPPAAKEPFILGVGRLWDEAKNARTLAHLAPGLPWPVMLAGDARSPDGARVDLPNVTLLGQLAPDALAAVYARAGIFAAPARYEPFGLSILEAALSGCALVLGNLPSLRELWEGAAIFVHPERPFQLANELRLLIDCDIERARLGAAARRRALAFSALRMTEGYRAVYRDTLLSRTALAGPAEVYA